MFVPSKIFKNADNKFAASRYGCLFKLSFGDVPFKRYKKDNCSQGFLVVAYGCLFTFLSFRKKKCPIRTQLLDMNVFSLNIWRRRFTKKKIADQLFMAFWLSWYWCLCQLSSLTSVYYSKSSRYGCLLTYHSWLVSHPKDIKFKINCSQHLVGMNVFFLYDSHPKVIKCRYINCPHIPLHGYIFHLSFVEKVSDPKDIK